MSKCFEELDYFNKQKIAKPEFINCVTFESACKCFHADFRAYKLFRKNRI